MKKRTLNLSRLEKLSNKELIKRSEEGKKEIIDENNFLNNYEKNLKKFKEEFLLFEKKIKEINSFFHSSAKIKKHTEGIIFKDFKFDVQFESKAKLSEYLSKFKEILKIYNNLLSLNGKQVPKSLIEKRGSWAYRSLPENEIVTNELYKENNGKRNEFNFKLNISEYLNEGGDFLGSIPPITDPDSTNDLMNMTGSYLRKMQENFIINY